MGDRTSTDLEERLKALEEEVYDFRRTRVRTPDTVTANIPPGDHGDESHTVAYAKPSDLDAKADLTATDGVLQSSQVPNIAISETYAVADQTERLALDVQEGDIAIQQDNDSTYIFTGGDSTLDSNWSEIIFNVIAEIDAQDITPASVDTNEVQNINYIEPQAVASEGTSYTADLTVANNHKVTMTGDVSFDVSNVHASDVNQVMLHLVQDATGGRKPSFTPTVVWPGGSAPSWSTSAGAEDVVTLVHDPDGGKWLGFPGGTGFA